MIDRHNGIMGPCPGNDWAEVLLPYRANLNEDELLMDPQYRGAMPRWDIWEWLEAVVPNFHDERLGEASWMCGRKTDCFIFMFKDPRVAAMFRLTFL